MKYYLENKVCIAIKDMSAGNDSVGEMWKETKIFGLNASISEIFEWIGNPKKNCVITLADNEINNIGEIK